MSRISQMPKGFELCTSLLEIIVQIKRIIIYGHDIICRGVRSEWIARSGLHGLIAGCHN